MAAEYRPPISSATQAALTAEATTRASADTALSVADVAEATARANADSAEVTARTNAINAAITGEATTRAAADTTNADAISAEATARIAADTTLTAAVGLKASTAALTAETDARTAADTALDGRLSTVESSRLVPTAVKTANYSAAANDYVPVDTTAGAVTVTLPSAPADGVRVGIKHVIQSGTNAVTIARGGSDVFNKAGGSTSLSLPLLNQGFILQYKASTGIWYAQSGDTPLSQLDARFLALTALDTDGTLAANSNAKVASQAAVKTYVDAHGGGAATYVPPRALARGHRTGQTFSTDFSNAARDAAMLDLTSFTYSTDAGDTGRPCLLPAAANVNAVLLMKAGYQWRDFDVRVRYRMTTATPHDSTLVTLIARYLSLTDYKRGTKSFNSASPNVSVGRMYTNAGNTLKTSTTVEPDITTTTPRYLRLRVTRNLVRIKSWLASQSEPDWQLTATRDTSGGYLEQGLAGVILRPITAAGDLVLHEFTATELIPMGESLLANGVELTNDERTSLPAWWSRSTVNTATRIAEVVQVADRNGITRNAFHLQKTVADASSCGFEQLLWSAQRPRFAATFTRNEPAVFDEFPAAVELGIWSKGTGVQYSSPGSDFLAFAFVGYHYAENGAGLNTAPYWQNLGPLTADGTGGVGTWDWTYNTARLIIRQPQRVTYLQVFIGFHDADVLGDVWFHDITLRPVG